MFANGRAHNHTPILLPIPLPPQLKNSNHRLRDECQRHRSIIPERRRDLLAGLVVAGETVVTRLDEDEAELGVAVLLVSLEVLAHGDRLYDEAPEVLRDGLPISLNERYIEHAAEIEGSRGKRGAGALVGEFDDLVDVLGRGFGLGPRRWVAALDDSGGRNALLGTVHATHG